MYEEQRLDAAILALSASHIDPSQKAIASGLRVDDIVHLRWKIAPGLVREAVDYIRANYRSVVDVELPFVKLSGYWRNAGVTHVVQDQTAYVTLTLAKGYLTTATWSYARVRAQEISNANGSSSGLTNGASDNPGNLITIEFPFVEPNMASAVAASLSAASYTDPIIGAETVLGTFINLFSAIEPANDGSATVLLVLARNQYVVEAYSTYGGFNQITAIHLWNVPENRAQTLIDAWKAAHPLAPAATLDFNSQQHTVNIILSHRPNAGDDLTCTGSGTSDWHEERADQTEDGERHTGQVAALADVPLTGNVITRVENKKDPDTGLFETQKRVLTPIDQESTSGDTRSDQTSAVASHTHATTQAVATRGAGEEKKIIRVKNRPTEWGTYLTEREVITPVNQSSTSSETRSDQTSSTAQQTQASDPVTASRGDGETNAIIRAVNRSTEFGNYATSREVILPVNQTSASSERRSDQITQSELQTQGSLAASSARLPGETNAIIRAENKLTEFGLWNRRRDVITPINQTNTQGETRYDQTTHAERATQGASEVSHDRGPGESNVIIRAENRSTEFGLFTTHREVITPINQAGSENEARADQTSATTTATQAEQKVLAVVAEGENANSIIRVSNRPTPFGLWETRREVTTPIDQTSSSSEIRATQTSETSLHTQNTAQVVATRSFNEERDSCIVRATNRPTPFGLFETQREVITPIAWTTDWIDYVDSNGTSQYLAFGNQPSSYINTIKSAFTSATNNSISTTKNEFGLYDGTATMIAVRTPMSDFDDGVDWTSPECSKHNDFDTFKSSVLYTTSKTRAVAHITAGLGWGVLVDFGAGERTGITYIGRGVYRASVVEGSRSEL